LFLAECGLASVLATSETGAESDKDEEDDGADSDDDSCFL